MDEENNFEENEEREALTEQSQRNMSQDAKRTVSKILTSNAKSKAAKQSLVKALLPIIANIGLGLLIIILIIGFAMFLVSMPGMAMEKMKQMLTKAGNSVAALFGADTTRMVKDDEVYEVLDYLRQMEYDLKSFGFLTKYVDKEADGTCSDDEDDGLKLDSETGKITDAESEYIRAYIISDNYIYTIKNANIVAQMASKGDFLGYLKQYISMRFGPYYSFMYKMYQSLLGPIADKTSFTDTTINAFGQGMLMFYYEDNHLGVRGEPVNFYSVISYLWGRADIKVDAEKKILEIAEKSILDANEPLQFSLEGWLGRYGMPLEFLLSVHLTTLKPDLCMDMIDTFPTNVNIYLHEITGTVTPLVVPKGNRKYNKDDIYDTEFIEALRSIGVEVGLGKPYCDCALTPADPDDFASGIEITYDRNSGCYIVDGKVYEKEVIIVPCPHCSHLLRRLQGILEFFEDNKYKTYQPYIASVTDHWFRDVYYVLDKRVDKKRSDDVKIDKDGNVNLVDYDYEFETMYKERWTLYETYNEEYVSDYGNSHKGDFILYELDDDGKFKKDSDGNLIRFDGSYEDAKNQDIAVSKKAKTLDNYDILLDDLDWNYYDAKNIWLAYDDSKTTTGSIQPLGVDETMLEGGLEPLGGKFFIQLNTLGDVIQKGEAQRTVTNPEIKNMFLDNIYFTYDGGTEKAEAITELRKKVASKAGRLNKRWYEAIPNEDKYMELSTEVNGKTYTVADCSKSVKKSEQDLLNISSMLENIHTSDADYIARDFKELIVELGYYSKEDLTDTTPRLLQWLVPNIGSYNYPKRFIDKNENEYGTMIHSKGDIDEAIKILIKPSGESNAPKDPVEEDLSKIFIEDGNYTFAKAESKKLLTSFDGEQTINTQDLVGTSAGDFKGTTFLETAKNCWEYIVNAGRYSYSGASIPVSNGNTVDCSSYVSWCIYEHGYEEFEGVQHDTIKFKNTNWNELYGWEEIPVEAGEDCSGKLQPGDILVRDNGGGPNGHVQIIVSIEDGDILTYDCGPNNWLDGIEGHYSNFAKGKEWPGKIIRIDSINNVTKPYSGYNGNEAVVSPVTGILLEYGTYGPDDKDNIIGEEYRTNIDYKYNINGTIAERILNEEETPTEEAPTEETETDPETNTNNIPVDKVGYAKILVLDNKTYSLFEEKFKGELESLNGGKSFVNSNGYIDEKESLNKDEIEDWTDQEKTLYGYKEFAELYEKGGIAGNIIYIDGFVCEYPDSNPPTDEDYAFSPNGNKITIQDFKNIVHDNISSDNNTNSNGDSITEYIEDEEYKLQSKKVSERMNAEASVRKDASPTFYTNGTIKIKLNENSDPIDYDGIFIKEGTVLGRTMTDYELIVDEDMRDEKFGTYEELRGKKEKTSEDEEEAHIIGNYIRIWMNDVSKDNVENVEDYMKLDEGNGKDGQFFDLEKIDENSSMEDKIRAIISYLVEQGFSVEGACGICGNLIVESGLDPAIESALGYRGLAQWDPSSRWPKVRDWVIGEYNDENKFAGQVRAIYEFENNQLSSDQWDSLKSTTNIDEATEMFCAWYERAVGGTDPTTYINPGTLYQSLNKRKENAQKAYDVYMGEDFN